MLDVKKFENVFIDLMNPAQFEDVDSCVFNMIEHITKNFGQTDMEDFFQNADADVIIPVGEENNDTLTFFALGAKFGDEFWPAARVYWLEAKGFQAYWICRPRDLTEKVLKPLAAACFGIK